MRNLMTSDGVVHRHVPGQSFSCATAWETVPEDQRLWGKISMMPTDLPITCVECLANEPQPLSY